MATSPTSARPRLPRSKPASSRANGLTLNSRDADSRFTAATESAQRTGTAIGFRGALALADGAALGGGWLAGNHKNDIFANLGLRLGDSQRLVLTGAQLKQKLDFDFPSGAARAEMTQNAAGAAWRLALGGGLFDYAEANAYTARTASRDLGAVDYNVDTATLYELWRDPRRIAGGSVAGLQGRLGLKPWDGGRLVGGFGQERLRYDLLGGAETHNRATGSLGLEQAIDRQMHIKFGADAAAAQSRYSIGLSYRFDGSGTLGIELVNIHGRDGAPGDNRVQLSWSLPLGKAAGAAASPLVGLGDRPKGLSAGENIASARAFSDDNLLDQVATRPAWLPAQVVARRDTTAAPTRLIAVDKTALPAGASVDTATGAITAPLGIVAAGIAGVTKNGGAFANSGQFALSGNNVVVNPSLIAQPAVGVTDVYVVTVNNAGGGTTLVTVNVSHGSVRIDSIAVSSGADATGPKLVGNALIWKEGLVGGVMVGIALGDPAWIPPITFNENIASVTAINPAGSGLTITATPAGTNPGLSLTRTANGPAGGSTITFVLTDNLGNSSTYSINAGN